MRPASAYHSGTFPLSFFREMIVLAARPVSMSFHFPLESRSLAGSSFSCSRIKFLNFSVSMMAKIYRSREQSKLSLMIIRKSPRGACAGCNRFGALSLARKGSGFASIHPSDEFATASLVLSGAAHEAAAGHAFPWPTADSLLIKPIIFPMLLGNMSSYRCIGTPIVGRNR